MSNQNRPQNPAAPRLFNIDDAASLCGSISTRTLRRYIASGTVRVTRIGRRVFLPSEEIERIRREGLPSLASRSQTPLKPQEISRIESQPLEKTQCTQTEV